jgi:hypothetical protein
MNGRSPLLVLPPGRRGAGRHSIRVDVETPLDDAALASIRGIVEVFCRAGSKGAFPAPDRPPAASRLMMGKGYVEEPFRLVCEVDGQDFDLLGFELLRNMGDRLARSDIRIRQFLVSPETSRTDVQLRPLPTWDNEFASYPPISSDVGFRLEDERIDVGKLRRCLVELAVCVEASHVTRIDDCVATWFDLLEAGAYSQPIGPAWETDCIRGGVAIFDEVTVELVVNRFQASETAWHAVINMLAATESPIAKVIVD